MNIKIKENLKKTGFFTFMVLSISILIFISQSSGDNTLLNLTLSSGSENIFGFLEQFSDF